MQGWCVAQRTGVCLCVEAQMRGGLPPFKGLWPFLLQGPMTPPQDLGSINSSSSV